MIFPLESSNYFCNPIMIQILGSIKLHRGNDSHPFSTKVMISPFILRFKRSLLSPAQIKKIHSDSAKPENINRSRQDASNTGARKRRPVRIAAIRPLQSPPQAVQFLQMTPEIALLPLPSPRSSRPTPPTPSRWPSTWRLGAEGHAARCCRQVGQRAPAHR